MGRVDLAHGPAVEGLGDRLEQAAVTGLLRDRCVLVRTRERGDDLVDDPAFRDAAAPLVTAGGTTYLDTADGAIPALPIHDTVKRVVTLIQPAMMGATALGLDRPFLVRFTEWSWQIVRYQNLGTSMFTGLPVTELIAQRIEPTLSLCLVTLVLSISIAVPMGKARSSRSNLG